MTTNLILASGSPRRKLLLEQLAIIFEIQPPDVDATRVVSNTNVSPTGLTASESAYLTNEEKTMKLKNRGKI